jgi:hypothetical protein
MDPLKNLKEVIVSGTYSAVDTAITLSSGEGAKLPDPAVEGEYNLPWYNSTDYASPAADPNAEFVRAISISGDVLIVQRPEVGNDYNGEDDENIASTKSVAGKVYKMQMAWSMKSIADVDIANAPATSAMEDTDEIGFWDTVLEKLTKITWDNLKIEIGKYLRPIGTIYENGAVATNPATLFGFGTWVAYGTGRVTVAIDAGDADFDTVDETGGEKTHQLTEAELASHDHPGVTVALKNDNPTDGERLHGGSDEAGTAGLWTPTVGDAGSDTAHNNVQPYIVVYRWIRVS